MNTEDDEFQRIEREAVMKSVQDKCFICGERVQSCMSSVCPATEKSSVVQPAPAPGYCKQCKQYSIEEPLPAAQRTWVGLTVEDMNEMTWGKTVYEILELAEAKLREKNT